MFEKVKFSNAVKFFESGFFKRHNSKPFELNDNALFVGIYSESEINLILNHKYQKEVMVLGADVPNIDRVAHDSSITFYSDKQLILNIFKHKGLKYHNEPIELKDFSNFKPALLGDKIYCYINTDTEHNRYKHNTHLLEHAIKTFGESKFIFGVHGKSESEVIKDYYAPSFINLQLNPFAGYTTALEMAKMGRKSISNTIAPFAIPFTNEEHITKLIEEQWNNQN
jgi:hypothetical protein